MLCSYKKLLKVISVDREIHPNIVIKPEAQLEAASL
jgi:hypothetical protein